MGNATSSPGGMRIWRFLLLIAGTVLVVRAITWSSALWVNAAHVCIIKTGATVDRCAALYSPRAWLAYRVQPSDAATQTLERFLAQRPDHAIAALRLGEINWTMGKKDDAIVTWRRITDADLYFVYRSVQAAEAGDTESAEQSATIVQTIEDAVSGDKAPMYTALCQAWRRERQPERALPWCAWAAQAKPDGWTQLELAAVQYDLGDYESEEVTLQTTLTIQDNRIQGAAYQYLGQLYAKLNRLEDSIAAYESALALRRTNQWVYAGLSQVLLRYGDREAACRNLAQAEALGYTLSSQEQADFDCPPHK